MSPTGSHFLKDLRSALGSQIVPEMELTLRVGVMSAGGLTRAEILTSLRHAGHDIDELDVKVAVRRLQRIATDWRDT